MSTLFLKKTYLFFEAFEIADQYHLDQPYGDLPYIDHLVAVAQLVDHYGEKAAVCALLHDILEDTPCSEDEILSIFGEDILFTIQQLSDPEGINRKERKRLLHQRLKSLDSSIEREKLAIIIKVADRLCNIRFSIEMHNHKKIAMYEKEHADFKDACFRAGVCDDFWLEIQSHFNRFSGCKI